MDDKFGMLLNELVEEKKKKEPERNSLGDRIGEQREIIVRYAVRREHEAKVYQGTPGDNGEKVDSYALLYAAAKLIASATDCDAKEIGDYLTESVLKYMLKEAFGALFKGLEDAFK